MIRRPRQALPTGRYVGNLYHKNAFPAILGAAVTPIPFKVFTIAAGIFHECVTLGVLLTASFLGRFGRFFLVAGCIFLVAGCIFFFGPSVKRLLEKYFEIAALALLHAPGRRILADQVAALKLPKASNG